MFRILRTSTAVAAGMVLAGTVLVAPGGMAASSTDFPVSWGLNNHGQFGNNSTTSSIPPVAVDTSGALAGTTVSAISAGGSHSCAVADGRAFCWGSNDFWNTSATNVLVRTAVDTSGALAGKTVTAISTGGSHTCAVAEGRAYCWGSNHSGELGNNSTVDSLVPVAVDVSGALAGKTVTAISAGSGHTCAVAEGRAYCWGSNGWGGRFWGNREQQHNDSWVPVAVDASGKLAGKTVTAISTGSGHTCAIADGRAYCWGANGFGGLGNNSTRTHWCRWRWTHPGCCTTSR